MPSGSGKRSKEDTWNEQDLLKAIKGDTKDRRHRSSERSTRTTASNGTMEEKKKESQHASKSEKTDKERHSRHRTEDSKGLDSEEREKKHKRHKTEEPKSNKTRESKKDREFHNKDETVEKTRKHRSRREDNVDLTTDSKKEKRREHQKERDDSRHKEDEVEKEKRKRERHKEREERKHSKDESKLKEKDIEKEKEKNERRKHKERKRDKESHHSRSEEKLKEGRSKESRHKSREKVVDRESYEKEKEKKYKEREKEMLKELVKDSNRNDKLESTDEKENEETNDYEYEDDFDEYDDDDFEEDNDDNEDEEDDESANSSHRNHKIQAQESMLHLTHTELQGVEEVLKAISDENKIAISQASIRPRAFTGSQQKRPDAIVSPKQSFGKINFIAASQKQINEKAAQKTKRRGQELLQLVQLDVRAMQLFDLPPMTEYELYMKRFGQSDAVQTFTQTNEDDQTQETQTDDFTCESKWCQFSHDFKGCGSDADNSTFNMESSMDHLVSTSSVRLNKFLLKASQVCISLLEELEAGIEQPQRQYTESRSAFSDGYVTLESSNFLVLGRNFCDLAYSMSQTNMLLTAYGASNVVKTDHKSPKGLMCVWNTNEPTKPFKLLTCESIPRSCCFSSGKASIAFAGMEDGVIAAWDLREPASYHEPVQVGNHQHIFRTATFTTSALSDNHLFPVVSVMPLTSNTSYNDQSSMESDIDFSFQLASLDESGVIHIWILVEVEVDSTDLRNVSDDLGLSPKGRIKLVKSDTISPNKNSPNSFAHFFAVNCLQIDPMKPNHIYFGTDQGEIIHMFRFGKRPTPKVFTRLNGGNCMINAIDVSPWRMPYLLAGYDDGTIVLFNLCKENPISSWSLFSDGAAIVDVKWSRSKPNVFFAMDDHSVLYLWDLLRNDDAPCLQYALKRKDKRATAFSFANDYTSLGLGTPGRPAEMAVVYGDGSVEIHRLTKDLCHLAGNELDSTQLYLDGIT